LDDASVGRNSITFVDCHNIVRHDLSRRNGAFNPVPDHPCVGSAELTKCGQGVFAPPLLIDDKSDCQQREESQQHTFGKIANGQIKGCRCEEKQEHRLRKDSSDCRD
jgi:hypothetical protein